MLIRYLGVDTQGIYAYLITIVSLFSFISDFGLQSLLVREIKSSGDNGSTVLGNAIFLQITQVIISIALINIYGAFFEANPEIRKSLFFASLAASVLYIVNPFIASINSYEKMHLSGLASGLASLFNSLIIFICVVIKLPLNGIILMLGFSNLLYLIVASFFCIKFAIKPLFIIKKETLINLFKMSIPFAMIGLFNFIYTRIDVPLLYKMATKADVGYYTAVTKIIDMLNALVMMFMGPIYPRLSYMISTENKDKAPRLISLTVKYMIFVVAPFAMMVSASSTGFVQLILGTDFMNSAPALAIMIWTIFLMAIYVIPTFALNSRQSKLVMFLYCIIIFINLGLNIILIPKYGFIATSFISVLCNLIIAIVIVYFTKNKIGNFSFGSNILKIFGALLVQLFFIKIFEKTIPFILLDILSLCIFYITILILRYFTSEDFTIAKNIFKANPKEANNG